MKLFAYMLVALLTGPVAVAQSPVPNMPTVDADSGPCSVTFTVLDGHGGPVKGAIIRMDADYGFLGLHNLDIEMRTGPDGRARFVGLPDKSDGVLYFEATNGSLRGIAVSDPRDACDIGHAIIMAPSTATVAQTEQ